MIADNSGHHGEHAITVRSNNHILRAIIFERTHVFNPK